MKRYSWLLVILVGFILFTFLDHQAETGDFKIYTWTPHYKNFDQLDSCAFDAIWGPDFGDSDWGANTMGLDMFPMLGGWWRSDPMDNIHQEWCTGASFFFEAEARDRFGREMLGFSWFVNNNCVGTDIDDYTASNGWARMANENDDNSGNVVGGLRNELDTTIVDPDTMGHAMLWHAYRASMWFQTQIWEDSITKHADYYAVFWIKVNQGAQDAQLRLKVEWVKYPNIRGVLAAETLDVQDLTPGSYDSVLVEFHKEYDTTNTNPDYFDTTITQTDVHVWWNGEDTVWIDRIDIYDELAWNVLTGAYDDTVTAFLNWDKYVGKPIRGFQLTDEPEPEQINVTKYWAKFIKNHPHDPPWLAYTPWAKAYNFYQDYWFEDTSHVAWHFVDFYINGLKTDSTSDSCTCHPECRTLQEGIDALLTYIDRQKATAREQQKELAYNVAACQAYDGSSEPVLRRPTQWEQEATAWLAVTHGVNVISYWGYSSGYKIWETGGPDLTPPWYFRQGPDTWVAWSRGAVYCDTTTDAGGFWERDRYHWEPHWSVIRRVNKQLHAVGNIVNDTSSWQAGFTCDSLGSWVSSFKSDKYSADSAYVEIATFEYQDTSYFLLVNRRCLSTEAQGVRVELDLPGDQYYIIGLEYFESGDSASFTDTTYSGKLNGKIPFSTYLAPGQGKFFKIIAAQG